MHAALFLVLAFFSAACVWMLLRAEFLAIALVLVYVGAVMVLFLFVVMMLDVNADALREGFWKHFPLAGFVGALIALEMALVLMGGFRLTEAPPPDAAALKLGNTKLLGIEIYTALPLPAADGGGAAAGGHHRGHRADAAPAQGQPPHGPEPAGAGEEGRPRAPGEDAPDDRAAVGTAGRRKASMSFGPVTLGHYLSLGGILFALSVIGIFLNRRNLIVLLMAIELMLLAVNLNFIAFSHYLGDMAGQVFVFFILTVAAAESAIGLAILVVLFRNRATDQRRRARRAERLGRTSHVHSPQCACCC